MSGHKPFRALREQLRATPEYTRLLERRRAVQELEVVDAVQALTAFATNGQRLFDMASPFLLAQ